MQALLTSVYHTTPNRSNPHHLLATYATGCGAAKQQRPWVQKLGRPNTENHDRNRHLSERANDSRSNSNRCHLSILPSPRMTKRILGCRATVSVVLSVLCDSVMLDHGCWRDCKMELRLPDRGEHVRLLIYLCAHSIACGHKLLILRAPVLHNCNKCLKHFRLCYFDLCYVLARGTWKLTSRKPMWRTKGQVIGHFGVGTADECESAVEWALEVKTVQFAASSMTELRKHLSSGADVIP